MSFWKHEIKQVEPDIKKETPAVHLVHFNLFMLLTPNEKGEFNPAGLPPGCSYSMQAATPLNELVRMPTEENKADDKEDPKNGKL